MIAKRADRDGNSSYRRLAEYIAAAKDPGEKLDKLWIVNSAAGETIDDLELAIRDIEATQATNTRVKADKTYHLIVSFRDEKPSPEAMKEIEKAFAEALGYGEHQRIAATHQNTDNYHLHIAFNKIHPETYKAHTPHRDFQTLERVCREMEQKHRLKVDLGREDKPERDQMPTEARDMEAETWEQSFYSYVQEHRDELLQARDQAKTWQDLHNAFAKRDLALRKRGNGLAIVSIGRNQYSRTGHIKASALDRSFSKKALEDRFGPYRAPIREEKVKPVKPQSTYERRPVTRHPKQSSLWKRYIAPAQKKSSQVDAGFRNWKQFLMMYALIEDPLAMAIIAAQKKMADGLFSPIGGPSNKPLTPSVVRPNLFVKPESKAKEARVMNDRHYLDVPFEDKDQAQELGARWDREEKRWYVTDDKDLKAFAKWTIPDQPALVEREIDPDMADAMGAFEESALSPEDAKASHKGLDVDGRAKPTPPKGKAPGPGMGR